MEERGGMKFLIDKAERDRYNENRRALYVAVSPRILT